jgi:AcrR family transcriptional regulator
MVDSRIQSRKQKIAQTRQPVQARSRQRKQEILTTTATLLDQVGFDDLTTILIARELGISVGSLYHYFPNKQAILHAMGESWLAEYTVALVEMDAMPVESLPIEAFVDRAIDRLAQVYREQKGILPLVQAMYAVPELRDLDDTHDELVVQRMSALLRRLGFQQRRPELERISRLWLEMSHALLLCIADQSAARSRASLADLKHLGVCLLRGHL